MMDFHRLFALGMKRKLPYLLDPDGPVFDIGASGKYKVPGSDAIGPPEWVHPRDRFPAKDNSVAQIHAYHFLEHLSGEDVVSLLREVERVLMPGGVLNFSVPYYSSTLAIQNLDHKSQWCEATFSNLFYDDTYLGDEDGPWKLSVHFLLVAGIVQRNMALVGQLVKGPRTEDPNAWYYPDE
jgi:SAM-dependent methyltransferase